MPSVDFEDREHNDNYQNVSKKFLPNSTSSLFLAKTKDMEIVGRLSCADEWIEIAKYKQLLYEKD